MGIWIRTLRKSSQQSALQQSQRKLKTNKANERTQA